MVVYAVFGDTYDGTYGIEVRCFGVFTAPEKAEELLQSLKKDKTIIRDGFVQEFVLDKEANEYVAMYIE